MRKRSSGNGGAVGTGNDLPRAFSAVVGWYTLASRKPTWLLKAAWEKKPKYVVPW
jgi:hypothetical protein